MVGLSERSKCDAAAMSTPSPRPRWNLLLKIGLALILVSVVLLAWKVRRAQLGPVEIKVEKFFSTGEANTLGMHFLPVPDTGLLFGATEVRVREFRLFVEAMARDWPAPDLETSDDHPAVNVTWDDARDFCAWLTSVERERGSITPAQEYRLPTDTEWSRAAALTDESGHTPAERANSVQLVYVWGSAWPPPAGAGNFAGEEAQVDPSEPGAHIAGYRDAFPRLAPVGQFAPNRFGLYDLAGNALEWCEDWFSPAERGRVMRGGSWLNGDPQTLALGHRAEIPPRAGFDVTGFRCVLAPARGER